MICWLWLAFPGIAQAETISHRMETFPHWQQPHLPAAAGDLIYPAWFQGDWRMESTLTQMVAPLSPEIVSPGFQQQTVYLDQPISSQVRFQSATELQTASPTSQSVGLGVPIAQRSSKNALRASPEIVADRAFNGLSLARAYLGEAAVLQVQVDPKNPNRQRTQFRGGRELIATITGRQTESPNSEVFLTTELSQQQFQRGKQVFFNTVETTTAYHLQVESPSPSAISSQPQIWATQITAIYLSPQDPDYLKALNQPVALYQYTLKLTRDQSEAQRRTQ